MSYLTFGGLLAPLSGHTARNAVLPADHVETALRDVHAPPRPELRTVQGLPLPEPTLPGCLAFAPQLQGPQLAVPRCSQW
jgi:hypothetical protein